MTLAEILTAEAVRQGLSLRELSRRTGQSPSRVRSVLGGATPNPGILTVRDLLAAMGKDLGWLHDKQAK